MALNGLPFSQANFIELERGSGLVIDNMLQENEACGLSFEVPAAMDIDGKVRASEDYVFGGDKTIIVSGSS